MILNLDKSDPEADHNQESGKNDTGDGSNGTWYAGDFIPDDRRGINCHRAGNGLAESKHIPSLLHIHPSAARNHLLFDNRDYSVAAPKGDGPNFEEGPEDLEKQLPIRSDFLKHFNDSFLNIHKNQAPHSIAYLNSFWNYVQGEVRDNL
ncbi:hypothetical protein D3C75_977790 [compost metagenome]